MTESTAKLQWQGKIRHADIPESLIPTPPFYCRDLTSYTFSIKCEFQWKTLWLKLLNQWVNISFKTWSSPAERSWTQLLELAASLIRSDVLQVYEYLRRMCAPASGAKGINTSSFIRTVVCCYTPCENMVSRNTHSKFGDFRICFWRCCF